MNNTETLQSNWQNTNNSFKGLSNNESMDIHPQRLINGPIS